MLTINKQSESLGVLARFKRLIFWLHFLVGVGAGVLILIMCVTGSVLVFESQILNYFDKDVRFVQVPSEKQRLSLNLLLTQVQEQTARTVQSIRVESDASASIYMGFGRNKGGVFVDPYTGHILGPDTALMHWFHEVEDWHRWFGITGKYKPIADEVKAIVNILMLIMVVSGVYLWWPRKVLWFKKGLKGNARDWNWHNAIGIWSAPFLILGTLTGVVMSYAWATNALYYVTGNTPPVASQSGGNRSDFAEGKANRSLEIQEVSFQVLMQKVETHVPHWRSVLIRNLSSSRPITVSIEEPVGGYLPTRSQLTLDASGASVIKWEPASEQNAGRKARIWARYLHTGEAGGPILQIVAFLSVVGAIVLIVTGYLMAYRRVFKKV